tara:strand:- start:1717 stop:1899 length:183 start_codon:yes stop_codon:yes gene_type:complete
MHGFSNFGDEITDGYKWSQWRRSRRGGNISKLLTKLQARATYYENVTCTTSILTALENIE